MDKVRMGIIGIGNMGSAHAKSIAAGEIPGLVLTAVADRKESRREWAVTQLGEAVQIYKEGEELIASGSCDAVLVATPHYQHPDLVISAFHHGLHALCEKPAGVYTKQVRRMNEEADKYNLVFAVMFNQRTNPVYRRMKELVDNKSLGAIKRVNWIITDWYRTQAYYDSGEWRATWDGEGGGVLLNQCPHNLDLLQWICGLPKEVQAFCHNGKWHNIEVEDDVTAYFTLENGATGVFITTTGDAPGTNRLEITLEKGKLVSENDKLTVYELEVSEREYCFYATEGFKKPEGAYREEEITGDNPQHKGVLKAFTERILYGTPLVADGREGIRGLMLSNAMHLSSWLKKSVTLPIDEDLFLEELNKRRKATVQKEKVKDITFDTSGSYGNRNG
ncbi:Gfo/Idh/MocA family oxidoreductase [Anaerocolumna sp. AGMB13020]|uniref:Gfo/Idh/MocA family protein n=1 Tax=Anaerocolumna sp. AGMB13020 TaxID=3081750 RepID=UPI0029559E2D|nr:Gfo/Idh/MocA family oxidoreductase [Anaerocolumna sp. AGMB13020]WOO36090.1 Gfo/Idh/MocA family oxidoreductase [Anaerocolumna sp. AGMB13020]